MILVALGSNLIGPWGSPEKTVITALQTLDRFPIALVAASRPLITKPFGKTNQPHFVNAVAIIKTALSPEALLNRLQAIESLAGRKRRERWGPRTLDLDIIDYNGRITKSKGQGRAGLTLPHPGIALRYFVLAPILTIAPLWKHPVNHLTAAAMIQKL